MDNPQDLINQALGGNTPATKAEPATPTLPTPEPLSPTTPTESPTETPATSEKPTTSVQPQATQTQPAPAMDAVVPTELTNASSTMTTVTAVPDTTTEQPVMPEISNVEAKGEDVPLALVGATPVAADNITSTTPVVESIGTSVPPALTQPASTSDYNTSDKPKKRGVKKVVGLMVALLAMLGLFGGVGYWYYTDYRTLPMVAPVDVSGEEDCNGCDGGHELVWRDGQCVWRARLCGGGEEGEPTNTGNQSECTGCREGYEVEWNGTSCIKRRQCNYTEIDSSTTCQNSGGYWCRVTDANGASHEFCGDNAGRTCATQAVDDHGITMSIGKVECVKDGSGWKPADSMNYNTSPTGVGSIPNPNYNETVNANLPPEDREPPRLSVYDQVDRQCDAQSGSFTGSGNTEMWICPVGTSVACTGNVQGARRFYGNATGCFCGVIQVDTGSGHQSYSSTCGCDEPGQENSPSPSPSAGTPTFMCNTLTRTPATTPAIGSTYTFTCAGSSAPVGSVNLTYKFRYNINDGAYTALTNKTTTTAEMTVAQCGRYKVQCQACGTINGVLSCDPVWTPATAQ